MIIETPSDAYALLESLGAKKRLITHLKLVGEASVEIIGFFKQLNVEIDSEFVLLGVAIHDAGKINYPEEMDGKGCNHEPEGERILLKEGLSPKLARCCLSHARFSEMECTLEELLVALSDKLWKGKRESNLETEVIGRTALLLNKDRWDIFVDFDTCFEKIASKSESRLERSKN